jgi:hypothetical protein
MSTGRVVGARLVYGYPAVWDPVKGCKKRQRAREREL